MREGGGIVIFCFFFFSLLSILHYIRRMDPCVATASCLCKFPELGGSTCHYLSQQKQEP